jgi:ferritin
MDMDKKLQKAFNDQINSEFYASYLYLSMAAYFEEINLPGFAHWMKVQSKEETGHGMRIYDFLVDRGVRVILQALAKPPAEFKSPMDAFEKTLAHEKMVTDQIEALYRLAGRAGDVAATVFLHWFVEEQVEEEKNPMDVIAMLKMAKPDSGQIMMIDRKLGERKE